MITIGDHTFSFDDPRVLAAIVGALLVLLVLGLLISAVRRAGRSADAVGRVAEQVGRLNADVQMLGAGQQQLAGNIQTVSDTQTAAQTRIIQTMETRLANVQQQMSDRLADNAMRTNRALTEMQERMKETLHGSSEKTTESLTQLQERLATIDKAQTNIEKLSGDVLSLQDILSNKQTRGAFGEIQLRDIVSKALPSDAYAWQATLSNGRRADCLIHLPNPPGPIVIDAKFPLTSYMAMLDADDADERSRHAKQLGVDTKKHIKDIADKYILPGETSDSALMFIPSEAVYAEIHAHHPDVIELSHRSKVYLVSPTTMMATLTTVRAVLRDVRMREQAGLIQVEISVMLKDVERLMDRVRKLETHFDQADRDIKDIRISANKISSRGTKIEELELDEAGGTPSLGVADTFDFD
jgi:DNA recombination protein RmuC